ncbi:outer membrane beta-barrel protein [Cyclobacterium jeungdonense]|uniref:Outer membrane beta-barrel protein n=1 Tax=Cyclobacterium jeungdonense TaxID=708087 RepID=A0ABT8C6H8_9BACT|nr:outer membrane beta-barrel protein [Cyclobacterium jeungdonense]MDN3688354.1 outer membrane beta-barrel protein [Cyclobacterium jeungdonense]
MKQLFFFVLAIGLCLVGFQGMGQVSQGTHALGLGINWEDRDIVGERNNFVDNFKVSPSYSYFIKDRLSVIGEASFHNRNSGYAYPNANLNGLAYGFERKEADVSIGLRKYVGIQPKLFLMGTSGLKYHWNDMYSHQVSNGDESSSQQSTRQFGLFGNLGLAYFPHEKFSFELVFLDVQFFRIYNKIRTYHSVDTHQYHEWSFEVEGFLNQPSLAVRYYF